MHFMSRMFATLLVATLLTGGSGCRRGPTGLSKWEQVRSLADSFVLKGDAKALVDHCDFTGVPPDVMKNLKPMLENRRGVPENVRHVSTEVMTPKEYEAWRKEEQKDWPEHMKQESSPLRWNFPPEKFIAYTFLGKRADDKTKLRMSVGAYQRGGEWFFSASYMQP